MKKQLTILLAASIVTFGAGFEATAAEQPKLILAITIDGLRGDNHETLQTLAIDRAEAERALAEEILEVPGIALAMTRTDLMAGTITDSPIMRKVQRAFHPKLSGDVLIVQDQFWYLYPDAEEFAAMHGSPYAYDTYVPVMLAGPGIPNQS